MASTDQESSILVIEPFYGGSHKQLVDILTEEFNDCVKFTLPAKKWHWKARTSALYFADSLPYSESYRVLFCSSVLNLCELVSLRPDLGKLMKVIYFHENQLVYPVRKQQDRDFQYGYNQITSSLVADKVVFNSKFNMDSFLSNIQTFLKLIPDNRPKNVVEKLVNKCSFLHFPILFNAIELAYSSKSKHSQNMKENSNSVSTTPVSSEIESLVCERTLNVTTNNDTDLDSSSNSRLKDDCAEIRPEAKKLCVDGVIKSSASVTVSTCKENPPLHIVWPHRWEHDKNPEAFFQILRQLHEEGLRFNVSVLGETFTDVPEIFEESREILKDHILHWGYLPSKSDYYKVLHMADVVISTAFHEFFGVAIIEAVHYGCYPICPNRLVYPEILQNHSEYLYNTDNQMLKKLRQFCKRPQHVRNHTIKVDVCKYSWASLKPEFVKLLGKLQG